MNRSKLFRVQSVTSVLFTWTAQLNCPAGSMANRDALLAIGHITGRLMGNARWEFERLRASSPFLKYLDSEHLLK